MPRQPYGWDDRDSDLWSALRQLPSYGLIAGDKENPMISRKEVIALMERAAKERGQRVPLNAIETVDNKGHHTERSIEPQTAQPSDTERLDWLATGKVDNPEDIDEIVNGFRFGGKFRGDIRSAIDAAMQAGKGGGDEM